MEEKEIREMIKKGIEKHEDVDKIYMNLRKNGYEGNWQNVKEIFNEIHKEKLEILKQKFENRVGKEKIEFLYLSKKGWVVYKCLLDLEKNEIDSLNTDFIVFCKDGKCGFFYNEFYDE